MSNAWLEFEFVFPKEMNNSGGTLPESWIYLSKF